MIFVIEQQQEPFQGRYIAMKTADVCGDLLHGGVRIGQRTSNQCTRVWMLDP